MVISECRSCPAKVIWAKTENGKLMPVDARPVEGGNIELEDIGGGPPLALVKTPTKQFAHKSHFATCPNAETHRGKSVTNKPDFDGSDYDAKEDRARLTGQMEKIRDLMKDHEWRTLEEIEIATGFGEASILAQLGNLRKKRFGQFPVEKRSRGERIHGLFEYQLGEEGKGILKKSRPTERIKALEYTIDQLAKIAHGKHGLPGNWLDCNERECELARTALEGF